MTHSLKIADSSRGLSAITELLVSYLVCTLCSNINKTAIKNNTNGPDKTFTHMHDCSERKKPLIHFFRTTVDSHCLCLFIYSSRHEAESEFASVKYSLANGSALFTCCRRGRWMNYVVRLFTLLLVQCITRQYASVLVRLAQSGVIIHASFSPV